MMTRPFQHPFMRLLAGGLCLLAVSACGSDRSETAMFRTVQTSVSSLATALNQPKAPPVRVTRAVLDTIVTPVDLVTLEKFDVQAVVAKIATNGDVETWSSVDNRTFAMREGVILSSRGFAGDLMSAQVPRLSQIKQTGQPFARRYGVLSGDDQTVMLAFDCQTARVGAESITIVDRSFATHRITETCTGPSGAHKNDYWLESSGKLRRSRQWVGLSIGFVVVEHLQ